MLFFRLFRFDIAIIFIDTLFHCFINVHFCVKLYAYPRCNAPYIVDIFPLPLQMLVHPLLGLCFVYNIDQQTGIIL